MREPLLAYYCYGRQRGRPTVKHKDPRICFLCKQLLTKTIVRIDFFTSLSKFYQTVEREKRRLRTEQLP